MSAQKIVKMMTFVEGKPAVVGQCHPGQARLLQKKGMAEWKEGKLWLVQPVQPREPTLEEKILKEKYGLSRDDLGLWLDTHEPSNPQPDPRITSFHASEARLSAFLQRVGIEEILEEAGVVAIGGLDALTTPKTYPTNVEKASWPTLLKEYRVRVGLGHECYSVDDPKKRTLGFLDVETHEYVCVQSTSGLAALTEEDAQEFGVILDELLVVLRTSQGRVSFFGDGEFFGSDAPEEEAIAESIWASVPDADPLLPPVQGVGDDCFLPPRPPREEGESMYAYWKRLQTMPRFEHPLATHRPGWTHFKWPDAHAVLPVYRGVGGVREVCPPTSVTVVGIYKRKGSTLDRIWWVPEAGHFWWDTSVMEGVDYTLTDEGAVDSLEAVLSLVG